MCYVCANAPRKIHKNCKNIDKEKESTNLKYIKFIMFHLAMSPKLEKKMLKENVKTKCYLCKNITKH